MAWCLVKHREKYTLSISCFITNSASEQNITNVQTGDLDDWGMKVLNELRN